MRRWRFRIPREGQTQETSAQAFVVRAWPEGSPEQIRALFDAGAVRADQVVVTRPDRPLAPQVVVEMEVEQPGTKTFGLPDVEVLLRGDDWVVVDKPVGVPGRIRSDDPTEPVRFLADLIGIDRDSVEPVWHMPATAGGPWLLARSTDVADRLNNAIWTGPLETTWTAIVERPPHSRGRWDTDVGGVQFAVARTRGGLAEVQLTPQWNGEGEGGEKELAASLLAAVAGAGFPVVGDAVNGGYLVGGGLRLRLTAVYGTDEFAHSWPVPDNWWPDEPVLPPEPVEVPDEPADRRSIGVIEISDQTVASVGDDGHPWILRDRGTGPTTGLNPGDPVQLIGPGGALEIYAVVDGTGPVAARVWSRDRGQAIRRDGELEIRLDEAIGRRRAYFRQMGSTDVFRLVHGEADGMPGVFIDRLGPVWRVTSAARCARGYRDAIYRLLSERDPDTMIIEVEAFGERRDAPTAARIAKPGASFVVAGEPLIVRENGLRFRIDPWTKGGVGLCGDQRDNRRRAVRRAGPGEHWLDPFCGAGAFGVALGRAGVETTNLDPTRDIGDRRAENFALNDVSELCRQAPGDTLDAVLDGGTHQFDGVIFDPPAAGPGERGPGPGRQAFEELVTRCVGALATGGSMLVCRRDPGFGDPLPELIERAAAAAGRDVENIEPAPAPDDVPSMDGFPEGDPFEGRWVTI